LNPLNKKNDDIENMLIVFPEGWNRSKRQYVRLSRKNEEYGSTTFWIGRKYDYSLNGNKAKIEYSEEDIQKLRGAPDASLLYIRNNRGESKFEKRNGKWIQSRHYHDEYV